MNAACALIFCLYLRFDMCSPSNEICYEKERYSSRFPPRFLKLIFFVSHFCVCICRKSNKTSMSPSVRCWVVHCIDFVFHFLFFISAFNRCIVFAHNRICTYIRFYGFAKVETFNLWQIFARYVKSVKCDTEMNPVHLPLHFIARFNRNSFALFGERCTVIEVVRTNCLLAKYLVAIGLDE